MRRVKLPIVDSFVGHIAKVPFLFSLRSIKWTEVGKVDVDSEGTDIPAFIRGEQFDGGQDIRLWQFRESFGVWKFSQITSSFYDSCGSTSMICERDAIGGLHVARTNHIECDEYPRPFRAYLSGALVLDSVVRKYREQDVDSGDSTYDIFAVRHKWLNFSLGCLLLILACGCFRRAACVYFDHGGLAIVGWIVLGFPLWMFGCGVVLRTY